MNRDAERNLPSESIAEESRPLLTSAQIPTTSPQASDVIGGHKDDVTSDGDSSDSCDVYAKTMMQDVNNFIEPATPAIGVVMAAEMDEPEETADSGEYSTGVLEQDRPVVLDTVALDTAALDTSAFDTGGCQATGTSAGEDDESSGSTDESATYTKVAIAPNGWSPA